jgi:hypothetical protein
MKRKDITNNNSLPVFVKTNLKDETRNAAAAASLERWQ